MPNDAVPLPMRVSDHEPGAPSGESLIRTPCGTGASAPWSPGSLKRRLPATTYAAQASPIPTRYARHRLLSSPIGAHVAAMPQRRGYPLIVDADTGSAMRSTRGTPFVS